MTFSIPQMTFSSPRSSSRARRVFLCAILLSGALSNAPRPARADEFATVASSDPLYRSMSVIARSGWLSTSSSSAPSLNGAPGANALLTRYEMALQTAEAIYTVTARHDADAAWDTNAASSGATASNVRALRELTAALRPELQKLGVDTGAALRLLARLGAPATAKRDSSTRSAPTLLNGRDDLGRGATSDNVASDSAGVSLARRFRIDSAVSALERESRDPLGNGVATRVQGAGLAFDVSRGLSLHAGYARRDLTSNATGLSRLGLQNAGTFGQSEERSLGGGVDYSLRNGLLFSTRIEKVGGDNTAFGATRVTGGVGLSAWQNRLSLVAKLSRLTPQDVNSMAPSTMAGVNLGLDVSRDLSFNLLYQRLFSAPTTGRSGVLAGGVSVKF